MCSSFVTSINQPESVPCLLFTKQDMCLQYVTLNFAEDEGLRYVTFPCVLKCWLVTYHAPIDVVIRILKLGHSVGFQVAPVSRVYMRSLLDLHQNNMALPVSHFSLGSNIESVGPIATSLQHGPTTAPLSAYFRRQLRMDAWTGIQ